MKKNHPLIAYFSMEFAFHSDMPNYAGGLGVLAADMMYSCADLDTPMVGVTLFYHQDDDHSQTFPLGTYLKDTGKTISVRIEDRDVTIAIWQMDIVGKNGHIVPILFLSAYVKHNEKWDRDLTKYLYDSGEYTRIAQEAILGIGGVRALQALDYDVAHYHMNEGHAAFLTFELANQLKGNLERVKELCTFTTHTPVPAGFDRFTLPMVHQVLTDFLPADLSPYIRDERLGMARIGFALSKSSNSVSECHKKVSEEMFPGVAFKNVTNGIYHPRWIGTTMQKLYDKYLPGWMDDPTTLSGAPLALPQDELFSCRHREKVDLCNWVNAQPDFFAFDDVHENDFFDPNILTLGFARRYVPYKRHELVFQDIEKLLTIGKGRLQFIIAGRCHPNDNFCNTVRDTLYQYARELRGDIKIVIVPDYDLDIAKRLIAGVDIWLNTPVPPREASGTSGMKAALNGVLNLSVSDGWWLEGFALTPQAGWTFLGTEAQHDDYLNQHDAYELLLQLEDAIDCYYNHPSQWYKRMTHAISLISTYNTHRVIREYQQKMWP